MRTSVEVFACLARGSRRRAREKSRDLVNRVSSNSGVERSYDASQSPAVGLWSAINPSVAKLPVLRKYSVRR